MVKAVQAASAARMASAGAAAADRATAHALQMHTVQNQHAASRSEALALLRGRCAEVRGQVRRRLRLGARAPAERSRPRPTSCTRAS